LTLSLLLEVEGIYLLRQVDVMFMQRNIGKEHSKANQGLIGYIRSHVSDQPTNDAVERSMVRVM